MAAAAAGADGIIVEVHPAPEEAICDGPQQSTRTGWTSTSRAWSRRRRWRARCSLGARLGARARIPRSRGHVHSPGGARPRAPRRRAAPGRDGGRRGARRRRRGGRAGVVAFENSLEGSVAENLDEILRTPEVVLAGERALPVSFALLRAPGDEAPLRAVASHPFALAQCARFLREHRLEAVEAASTAAAARELAPAPRGTGALAPVTAAKVYGLRVERVGLEDEAGRRPASWRCAPAARRRPAATARSSSSPPAGTSRARWSACCRSSPCAGST